MTDYVRFKELTVHDKVPTWTLEGSIENCAALGYLHDFDFATLIDETFAGTLANWETGTAEGTWEIEGGQLKGTGGGADRWYRLLHSTDVPSSFVATFTKEGATGGFVLYGGDYLVWWWGQVGIATLDSGGAATILAVSPIVVPDGVEIAVAARKQCTTEFDVVDWVSIAVYVEGRCVVATSDYVGETTLGDGIGFAVGVDNTTYFDDLEVPELHRIVEWTSVDPTEAVASGMNRAIGSTPLFYLCRYDGTLKAWLPGNRDVDWANVPTARELRKAEHDNCFAPARARMVGAYHEADMWDQDAGEKQGRSTFEMLNDPNLMSLAETQEGGEDAFHRLQEGRRRWNVQLPGSPLVEPQDRITDEEGDDLRATSIQYNAERRGKGAPVVMMQIEAIEYEEET